MDIIKAFTNPIRKKQLAIIVAGLYACFRGIAYLSKTPQDQLPKALEMISAIIPIQAWGAVWMVIGIMAIITGIAKQHTRKSWPIFVGMMTAWGMAYFYGWFWQLVVDGEFTNGWLTGSSYLLPAVIIGLLSYEAPIEPLEENGDEHKEL